MSPAEQGAEHGVLERFYVTVRSGPRLGVLAGPYPSYLMAADQVGPTRRVAEALTSWAVFHSFGVSRLRRTAPGLLNDRLEEAA